MSSKLTASIAFTLSAVLQAGAQRLHPERVYPAFGIGPTGIHATIEKGLAVTVASVDAGSPAAASKGTP